MLRQAIIATEDAEFEQHFGINISRIVVAAHQGHHRAAQAARREHADAAARAQAVPDRREDVGAQDQGSAPRDPDREALHQARDLHALLQPDVPRPRRLRRRGGVAAVLRQVDQGPVARRSGADRRHLPGQRAPEPVRRHGAALRAPQLHAAGWRKTASSRTAEADAAKQKPIVTRGQPTGQPSVAPFFVEEVRKQLEARYGAKGLYENGLSVQTTLDVRAAGGGQPRARGRAAPHRQAPRLPEAEAQRPRRRPHDRGVPARALGSPDGGRRLVPAVVTAPTAPTIAASRRPVPRHDRSQRASPGRGRPPATQLVKPGDLVEVAARHAGRRARRPRPSRSSRRRSSKARCSRSTTAPARSRRWSAAGASSAASSTARRRRTGSSARRSSRSSTPRRSTAASRRRRSIMDAPRRFPGADGSAHLQAAQLRPQVRGADHAAARARRIAQHPGDQDDGAARAEERARLRATVRLRGDDSAVPADRARRRRRDAARDDERLHRVPEPGRADEAVRS